MGRRKITIKQIADPKLRHITFNKRKNGLIKKAAELSLLCNVNMLLIFEDGNGNLIQFSKNKIQNIPAFFQECNYNNVLDFSAKDYPTFFKVNHYKKHKERENDSYDGDDLEFGAETSSKNYSTGPSGRSNNKRERISTFNHIKEEDNESHVIYQSGSEESDGEDLDMNVYSDYAPQREVAQVPQQKKNNMMKSKPTKMHKPEEKRIPSNENQSNVPVNTEQDVPKESFQSYKDTNQRQNNFAAPFMADHSFNRPTANPEQTSQSFRFYPTETNNMPAPNTNNGFVSNTNFGNNLPYLNNNAFQTAPNQNNFKNQKQNMLRGFGNLNMTQMNPMANMANMAGMANIGNMGAKGNEETFNAMFKGFPLGFAIGGANPFITKNNAKPEIDEKVLETAHMIKYLNNAAPNGYGGQKMYNFRPDGNGKNEEEALAHLRNNEHGGVVYEGEGDYSEMPAYVRGDYRLENAIPSNLPSAYFSSKKFNFDGYFNNFEEDRYNDYADQKKKLKQMN